MPRDCVGDGEGDRGQVGRERGPRAILDLRDLGAEVVPDHQLLAAGHADGAAFGVPLDAEALEAVPDTDHVLGDDVLDHHLPLGDGAKADEAGHLDVVGADPPLAAAEAVDAAGW